MDKGKLEFNEIYNKFHEKIRRYMKHMVGKDGAEDLTQVVFMKVNR